MSATPEEVLDTHARLVEILKSDTMAVHSYFTWFIHDSWRKNKDRAAGMFYPLMNRGKVPTRADGAKLAHMLAASLEGATTYQVSAEMVQAMRGVWEKTMVGKIMHLDLQELPCESGFAWLDETWQMFDIRGDSDRVRAVSWEYLTARVENKKDWLGREVVPNYIPAVRVSLWTTTSESRACVKDPEQFPNATPEQLKETERHLGSLSLMHTAVVPFDIRWNMPDPEEADGSADSFAGLVHMLWMFLGMEIVATRLHQPVRAFRHRVLKSIRHGEVHVVLLRRLARPGTDEELFHRDVDWGCQWVVQGHWRHWERPSRPHRAVVLYAEEHRDEHNEKCEGSKRPHRHCLQCGGPVEWVRPYCKGPEGLPLKVSRTLMKLAR